MKVIVFILDFGLEIALGRLNQHPSQSIRYVWSVSILECKRLFIVLRLAIIHPGVYDFFFFSENIRNVLSHNFFYFTLGFGKYSKVALLPTSSPTFCADFWEEEVEHSLEQVNLENQFSNMSLDDLARSCQYFQSDKEINSTI